MIEYIAEVILVIDCSCFEGHSLHELLVILQCILSLADEAPEVELTLVIGIGENRTIRTAKKKNRLEDSHTTSGPQTRNPFILVGFYYIL